jgi:hypothetical protein
MIDKIKRCFRTVWEFFKHQLKDRITRWTFIIVYLVLSSPIWVCYILSIVTKNGWFAGIATTYWLFWAGPFTPFIGICLAITTGIRLLIKKIFKR